MEDIKTSQFQLLNIKPLMYEMKNTLDEIKQIRNCEKKY